MPLTQPTEMTPIILWFRFDLRLHDHAGLAAALATGRPILPIYIWDETASTRPLGSASRWWLHRSLHVLDDELRKFGSRLIIATGDAHVVLANMAKQISSNTIFCSHTLDPKTEHHDLELKSGLDDIDIKLRRFNTGFLTDPSQIKTKENKPYKVYTPYNRALLASGALNVDSLSTLSTHTWPEPAIWPQSMSLDQLRLNATKTASGHDWSQGFNIYTPGERGARKALRRFMANGLADYETGRDRPDKDITSRLSPHLRFGEICPKRILLECQKVVAERPQLAASAVKFRDELVWREFNYNILHQQPDLHQRNFRADFDGFPWRDSATDFKAWTRGETGYPLVDAGMKELWQTGIMHNRVRMVAASFLIKHLLIDWRKGEQWFWDCLLDADPASNPGNWQWVAGCGADAAPYFRVFNPISQAEKFDPETAYRQQFAPNSVAGRDLFDNVPKRAPYPQPMVDHVFARDRALNAYKTRGDVHDDDAD